MADKGIPIALICDDNYVVPTSVTISTMISSKKVDTCYDIYIVCASLSEANESIFSKFASETVAIHIIREDVNKFSDLHGFTNPAACVASPAALLKFALPDIFKDYEKLLYLDGDLLVRTDLADLYNIELGDNLVAAVLDSSATYKKQYQFVPYYFNSGVMVLNIKQMRLENTKEALIKEKIEHGVTYLMDQHAFNYVCTGRIHKLPIRYNLLAVILDKARDKWTPELINQYYGTEYTSQDEVLQDGAIIHFASKDKPWKYPFVMYAEEWFEAYRSSTQIPHTIPDYQEILNNTDITVSLTSYPERIGYVSKVVDCLCAQSVLPDRIVVYLAKEQFEKRNADLPDDLLKQVEDNKVEIHWCDLDLKPHKKYYYAMQEYPDDVIITVDDDVYLPNTAIEELLLSWLHYPKAIVARRTHLITFDNNGKVLPYSDWVFEYNILPNTPSMQLIGTGCSGILYPPRLFPAETFDANAIIENALYADDLWLKAHEAIKNIPTVSATENPRLRTIGGSQEYALWKENLNNGKNDEYLKKISHYVDKLYGGENLLQKVLCSSNGSTNLTGQEPVINFIKHLRRSKPLDEDSAKLIERGKAQLTARIDVKLFGDTADFDMKYISDSQSRAIVPDWFQKGGKGYQIETRQEVIDISFDIKTDGKLTIYLKGKNVRDADGIKRLPYWINYNMLTYNGITEFAEAKYSWHNKPITISHEVKAGEIVNLHIEWKPCKIADPGLPKRLETKLKTTEKKLKASLSRETSLKNSVSFRTGRAITWFPRKIRGGGQCLKEHGPAYTIKRFFWHITH